MKIKYPAKRIFNVYYTDEDREYMLRKINNKIIELCGTG